MAVAQRETGIELAARDRSNAGPGDIGNIGALVQAKGNDGGRNHWQADHKIEKEQLDDHRQIAEHLRVRID